MTIRSTSYTGEHPTGTHWTPGEVRTLIGRVAERALPLPGGLEDVANDLPAPEPTPAETEPA